MDNRSIGVFDSGLGGLTVLKAIMELLPEESLVYFGDSGRAPYGIKSRESIVKYTFQDTRFLLSHDIKMIVVACNTASAYGYDLIRHSFDIPVVEVIGPGAAAAVKATRNRKVGVIGTPGTISSGVYGKAINNLDISIEISFKACPMLVPLVEEGWWENDIALRIAEEYLIPMKGKNIDTLVLGCTHYPLLYNTIFKVMGEDVKLVNSGLETARAVKRLLEDLNIRNDGKNKAEYRYFTSDSVEKFIELGSSFLGRDIASAYKVDIEKY